MTPQDLGEKLRTIKARKTAFATHRNSLLILSYRNIHATFEAFLSQEAHGYYGKAVLYILLCIFPVIL